jgi:hypothetical protein
MKYVLLLSIYHKKYKDNSGEVNITINDRLIDIITLDKDIPREKVNIIICDHEGVESEYTPLRSKKIYYYEIEDSGLLHEDRENTLSISVQNDNNNYTNGFMTDSSYFFIDDIFFLPISLFQVSKIKKLRDRLWQKFWKRADYWNVREKGEIAVSKKELEKIKEMYIDQYESIDWHSKATSRGRTVKELQEKWLFDKFHIQKKGLWPGIVHPLKYNFAHHNQEVKSYLQGTIGGSFEVQLPITKKHKIFAIRQKNYIGPCMIDSNYFFAIMIEILKGSTDYTLISKNKVK